ncbi:MAG TPA: NAD(P)-dependent oxidoreductase [Thermoleophilaceae bacterium]|nr:NAD(P)-dependent oxidoreductase [Thermoleophilaceae bacterium]
MSRVLVTGASGFIGRRALAPLVEAGLEVHAVSRSAPPEDLAAAAEWHTADLLDPAAGPALLDRLRPERMLHLAWYAEHGRFWSSPENLRWVESSLGLLRAFEAAGGSRAVIAGSCAEYDWEGVDGPLAERSSPLRPATLYGTAKNALREVAEAWAPGAGVSLAWGRVFFLYGPGEHPDRLVASVARRLVAAEEAPTSEGSQRRDFMHVDDVAGAFAALTLSGVEGPVNIGTGEAVAVSEVVGAVARAAGRPDLVRAGALETRPGEPPLLVADATRLRSEVGFAPRVGLEEGVAGAVDWWRAR